MTPGDVMIITTLGWEFWECILRGVKKSVGGNVEKSRVIWTKSVYRCYQLLKAVKLMCVSSLGGCITNIPGDTNGFAMMLSRMRVLSTALRAVLRVLSIPFSHCKAI